MNPNFDFDFLAHYGVKGMKWGVIRDHASGAADAVSRKTRLELTGTPTATGKQIGAARANLRKQRVDYRAEYKQYAKSKEGTARREKLEASLRKREKEYLKDPDRVIAARMTKGEKFFAAYAAIGTGGLGTASVAGRVVGTSLVSRRIAYNQKTGAYDKASKAPLKKTLGSQRARTLAMVGASLAPSIIQSAGKKLSIAVLTKAAANREAARAVKPLAIAAKAAKTAYARKGLSGAYKITSM